MSSLFAGPWWVVTLTVIGIIALAGAVVVLFTSVGRRPGDIESSDVFPVDSPHFLEGLAGSVNAPLQEGGRVTALHNGDAFLPAWLEAIREAEHTIHWTAYIWEPGEMSDRIFGALTARARAGVQVRLLLDGIGGMRTPREGIEMLEEAGGKVAWFRLFRFGKITRFHKRNHRRAIVMDGRVGFTGGAAVGDKWLGDAQDPDHWRDDMYRVTGCIASNLQSAFTQLWGAVTGEVLLGPTVYPLDFPEVDEGETVSRHVHVASSPSAEDHPLRKVYWLSFCSARERLYITTPYFVPDASMRDVVRKQAISGVDVRILLPNEHTDARPIRRASHYYYEELLGAGVRIYEYQPTMMHAKSVVIDGKWVVVGSANMDVRSKELNQENVLGILDEEFGRELEARFMKDLEQSREIRLEEWRKRGWRARVVERACQLFEEQY
jgi:cardiolipin synthase